MTREETLKIAYNKRKDSAGEEREFYNAVISALEKENIYDDGEHYVTISKALYDKLNVDICEDAISREAVIEWLKAKDIIKMSWQEEKARKELSELPSVQPKPIECDDAISRAELYKAIDSWDKFGYTETGCFVRLTKEIDEKYVGYVHLEDVITAIQGMPSVQPSRKGHWIPVSERLPEDAYGCLVTVYDTDLKTQDEFKNILPYTVGYDGETWNNFCGEPIPFEVVAWMPLPEPYKDMRGAE